MMKKIQTLLLTCAVLVATVFGTTAPAMAETMHGDAGWGVTLTSDWEMKSTFKNSKIDDVLSGLQPGDNAVITLTLKNDNNETTDWYMQNEVLKSLEESASAALGGGGAYSYILEYTDKTGTTKTLYKSVTLGGAGEDPSIEGLHAADSSLKDFFYLDTLEKGQSGTIRLEVLLDGETQGNDYQDTLARIRMRFAVETGSKKVLFSEKKQVSGAKTGDYTQTLPYIIAGFAAGIVLLGVGTKSVRNRKKEGGNVG